jgi:hypothetical protein
MSSRAFSGSFQKSGDSDWAFRLSMRGWAVSQSKMPPQQAYDLLDFKDDLLDFHTHGQTLSSGLM